MSLSKTILMAHALLLSEGVVMVKVHLTPEGDLAHELIQAKDMYSDYGRTTRDNGDSRRVTINQVSRRIGRTSHMDDLVVSLAACALDPVIWAEPPPVGGWLVPKKTVGKTARQQTFRSRMRSVNRNR